MDINDLLGQFRSQNPINNGLGASTDDNAFSNIFENTLAQYSGNSLDGLPGLGRTGLPLSISDNTSDSSTSLFSDYNDSIMSEIGIYLDKMKSRSVPTSPTPHLL